MSWNTVVPEGVCSHQVSHKLPHSEKSTVHFCQLLLCEQRQAEPHLQQRFKSILHLAQLLPSSFLHFHFTRQIANSIYPCKAWLCHSGSQLIIDFLLMISPVTSAHSAVDKDFVFTKLYWSIEVVAERLVCFSPQQILPLCVPKQTVLPNSGALLLTTLHQNYTTERKKKMQSAQYSWLTV